MKFICFNGEQFMSSIDDIEIINNQFLYLKNENIIINYKTAYNDYQAQQVPNDYYDLSYLLKNERKLIPNKSYIEIGLNFAGFFGITNSTSSQINIGVSDISKVIPFNTNSFFGKVLSNINPNLSFNNKLQNSPIKGIFGDVNVHGITGSFELNGLRINFIKSDWVDYIKLGNLHND